MEREARPWREAQLAEAEREAKKKEKKKNKKKNKAVQQEVEEADDEAMARLSMLKSPKSSWPNP